MNQGAPASFWRPPPPWVWLIFTLAVGIFSVSMVTLYEGHRFVSRPLLPPERAVVEAALAAWNEVDPRRAQDIERLRTLLKERKIRAMDNGSFARAEERAAYGYTDERGRILLNPQLCFAYQRSCPRDQVQCGDLVATTATLVHESRHLLEHANEACAYEAEWRFVQKFCRWAEQSGRPDLCEEMCAWESEMPGRVEHYAGRDVLVRIQQTAVREGTD